MNGMDRGPIFIGGPDRCGKTTLRACLVSHPNIAIPDVGSNYWTYFYGQYGDLSRGENFERCLAAMLRYKHVRFLKPDPDRLRREFWQGEPTYARLFALFHEHYAEREGKPRWGDQTGLVERYADHIFAAYPTAKMLHLLRDPRDRYAASKYPSRFQGGKAGRSIAEWLYSVGLARRNQERYPDRYRIVRYETLVTHPEDTLQEVCAFVEEDYTPAMLTLDGAPRFRDKLGSGLHTGLSPPSPDFIGRFRQTIPKGEIAFLQAFAGRDMLAFDYPLELIHFSPGERLAFYLRDWPLNLARLLTWDAVEAIQHHLPAHFGRKPARKKAKQASLQTAAE